MEMNMTQTPQSSSRQKAILTLCVFALLALFLGAGMWWIMSQERPPSPTRAARSTPTVSPTRRPSGLYVRRGFIRKRSDGDWVVTSGEASIHVVGHELYFWISGRLPTPPDQSAMLRVRVAAFFPNELSATLKLTDDQIGKLKAIGIVDMVVSDEDKQHMHQLWDAYLAETNASTATAPSTKTAEQKLLDTLAALSIKSIEPTLEQHAQVAEQVRSILTPEQIAIATKAGFGQSRRAASRPTRQPGAP